jgi:hypothetical protein
MRWAIKPDDAYVFHKLVKRRDTDKMERNELLLRLDDALTLEEVPVMVRIHDVEELVKKADFDPAVKERILRGLNRMRSDSITHARTFSELIGYVLRSK